MIKSVASAIVLGLLMAGPAMAQSATPIETDKPAEAIQQAQPQPADPAQAQPRAPTESQAEAAKPAASTETAEAPSTVEACITSAADLGSVAESKTLSEDKLDQLDQLFSKMETLCDGKQFAEAMAVAGDIKNVLETH